MKKELVGKITHVFPKVQVAVVKVLADIKIGDKISIERGEKKVEQIINSMQVNHQNVDIAKAGTEIGLKIDEEIPEGSEVYRVTK